MPIAITLHILSAVIWVGGMFFAYMALRPVAAGLLEPPLRLTLWVGVFEKFFPWVWVSIAVLLATGVWMMVGGRGGDHVNLMITGALIMFGLFTYLIIGPYKKLKNAVAEQNWGTGGSHLGAIRRIVGINLTLGLIVVAVAAGGRTW